LISQQSGIGHPWWGWDRRLSRLKTSDGFYLWLAADHQLTFGNTPGLSDLEDLISRLPTAGFSGVVLNRGAVRRLSPESPLGLVLQTYGMPQLSDYGRKVELIRPEDVAFLNPDAVAVELSLAGPDFGPAIQEVARAVAAYERLSIPVLLMLTPASRHLGSLINAIHVASELGVALIKVGIPSTQFNHDPKSVGALARAVRSAPPVLLAGGPHGPGFLDLLALSRDAGFAGVCVGRNVFQAVDVDDVLACIRRVYSRTTVS
jgi:fructose-bisphosphate aldolase, class I